jgi:hypothetical protein
MYAQCKLREESTLSRDPSLSLRVTIKMRLPNKIHFPILGWFWRGGRVDYGDGLENRFRESERGFESHLLRHIAVIIINRRNHIKEKAG